jgi:phosphate transport system protein
MSKHLLRALADIDRKILSVGSMVEESINKAIVAVISRRAELAEEVIKGDDAIDRREVEFEEECLRILALHQPVATDLRFIVAVFKANSDLERMGDLASNIAERARELAKLPPLEAEVDFAGMADLVRQMVCQCLDALVTEDPQLAGRVCETDDKVDGLNHTYVARLRDLMHKDPTTIDRALLLLQAIRHLERIADHAVNIAEDVVYMVEGEVIRHSHPERQALRDNSNGTDPK